MKCPNCGKEAINVNGKHVCLDCGIEITPSSQTADDVTSFEPTIDNHQTSIEPTVTPPQEPESEELHVSMEEPKTEDVPETPVKDAYMEEVQKEETPASDGVFDFPSKDSSLEPVEAPVPDFPNQINEPVEEPSSEQPTEAVAPSEPSIPEVSVPEEIPEEPSVPLQPELPAVTENPAPEELPKEPAAPTPEPPTMPFEPVVPFLEPPVAPELPNEPADDQPTQEIVDDPLAGIPPIIEPAASAPVNSAPAIDPVVNVLDQTAGPVQDATQDNYFQPSTVDIAASALPAEPFQAPQAPVAPAMDQAVEEVPAQQPVGVMQTEPVPAGENLDDLLDKYSTPNTTQFEQPLGQSQANPATFDSVRPAAVQTAPAPQNMPGVSAIPTAESVFGAEGLEDPTAIMEMTEAKNKKLKIIIGISVGVVILLLVFFGFFAAQQRAKKDALSKREELVQTIMAGVSKKMDEPIDVKNTFKHTIDFSNVKLKSKIDPEVGKNLLSLFATPTVNEGTWETNSNGDIAQTNKVGATTYQNIYSDSDKLTYIKENNAWGKKEGRNISNIPVLYSAVERGSIFYASKVSDLQLVKVEEGDDGETLTTLKVTPTEEYAKELLSAVTPLLAKVNYQKIDAANLNIEVTVDDSETIRKVVAKGNIDVECDYFEGPVAIDSQAEYKYSASNIEKPEISQEKPLIILTNTVIQSDFEPTKKDDTEGRG